jgi:hypothetical protein
MPGEAEQEERGEQPPRSAAAGSASVSTSSVTPVKRKAECCGEEDDRMSTTDDEEYEYEMSDDETQSSYAREYGRRVRAGLTLTDAKRGDADTDDSRTATGVQDYYDDITVEAELITGYKGDALRCLLHAAAWNVALLRSYWDMSSASCHEQARTQLIARAGLKPIHHISGVRLSTACVHVDCDTCAICLELLGEEGTGSGSFACGHKLHQDCFLMMVRNMLSERQPPPYRCVYRDLSAKGRRCMGVLQDGTQAVEACLDAMDRTDPEGAKSLRAIWSELTGPSATAEGGQAAGCFTRCPKCPLLVRPGRWNTTLCSVTCACGAEFCRRCRNPPHEPIPCLEALQWEKAASALRDMMGLVNVQDTLQQILHREANELMLRVWLPDFAAEDEQAAARAAAVAEEGDHGRDAAPDDNMLDYLMLEFRARTRHGYAPQRRGIGRQRPLPEPPQGPPGLHMHLARQRRFMLEVLGDADYDEGELWGLRYDARLAHLPNLPPEDNAEIAVPAPGEDPNWRLTYARPTGGLSVILSDSEADSMQNLPQWDVEMALAASTEVLGAQVALLEDATGTIGGHEGSSSASLDSRQNVKNTGSDEAASHDETDEEEETDEAKAVAKISESSKPCPNCFVPITRSWGCNSMKCTSCAHDFCWTCLGPAHTHGQCTRTVDVVALKQRVAELAEADIDVANLPPEDIDIAQCQRQAEANARIEGLKKYDTSLDARSRRILPNAAARNRALPQRLRALWLRPLLDAHQAVVFLHQNVAPGGNPLHESHPAVTRLIGLVTQAREKERAWDECAATMVEEVDRALLRHAAARHALLPAIVKTLSYPAANDKATEIVRVGKDRRCRVAMRAWLAQLLNCTEEDAPDHLISRAVSCFERHETELQLYTDCENELKRLQSLIGSMCRDAEGDLGALTSNGQEEGSSWTPESESLESGVWLEHLELLMVFESCYAILISACALLRNFVVNDFYELLGRLHPLFVPYADTDEHYCSPALVDHWRHDLHVTSKSLVDFCMTAERQVKGVLAADQHGSEEDLEVTATIVERPGGGGTGKGKAHGDRDAALRRARQLEILDHFTEIKGRVTGQKLLLEDKLSKMTMTARNAVMRRCGGNFRDVGTLDARRILMRVEGVAALELKLPGALAMDAPQPTPE